MVKAAACGAAIRGFESPRSPLNNLWNQSQKSFFQGKNKTAMTASIAPNKQSLLEVIEEVTGLPLSVVK